MRRCEVGESPGASTVMSTMDLYSNGTSGGATTALIRSSRLASALPARSSYNDRHAHHHHHGPRRTQECLYRSNSSLELMQEHQAIHCHEAANRATPLLRREYGSHGSIDVIGASAETPRTDSFFDLLQEYRSPHHHHHHQEFSQKNGGAEPQAAAEDERSPKLQQRRMFHRLWVKAAPREDSSSVTCEEERQRRRAFAHYDCQSVTANLGYAARLRSLLLSRRRNTATGASAASMINTPDGGQADHEDHGDGRNNDLVESCPFFRNEIGGEEDRVVGLVRTRQSSESVIRREWCSPVLHRPALSCGLSVLEFAPGETHWTHQQPSCPYHTSTRPIESVDNGALYYRNYFYLQDHQNWFGMDENLGPVAISLKREKVEKAQQQQQLQQNDQQGAHHMFRYRVVIRTSELLTLRGSVLEDAIPNLKTTSSSKSMNTKEVLEYVAPEIQLSCLKLGIGGCSTEEALLKLDEQGLSRQYKVGVMYCRAGQSTEEQMYNNQEAGPALTEFLETIGQTVRLKGFDKYKAGLDNKTDSTGLYSTYAQYQDCEIMFHVSTLLPFTPNNRQQLLRKRHIGNDIVTIVFQEAGAQPFTPKVIRSQFQHVFIIVRAVNPCTDNTFYRVAVTRSKDVPVFGPPIPEGATFPKSETFAEFLLAKVINAENAAHRSDKFATMATRTRQEYLKDLVANYTTSTVVETNQKFSMLSFSSKKKERWRPRFSSDGSQRGAVCWQVLLDDSSQAAFVECFLAVSSDSIVLIEEATREVVFVTPCKSVLGWTTNTNSLRIYYHQGECITVHMREGGERDELMEVVVRLRSVTNGSAANELSLKRNPLGQLGFHVQPDGVVTQVEPKGLASSAGLRQGARLVEICKVAVSTLSHDQMVDLLKTSMAVTVTVIPPLADGSIRRGCPLSTCKYNSAFEGDYENVNNSDSKLNKSARQQAVVGNMRKRYERSFSPPRSSNSSGYGTGSSSKSFTGADRFINLEGTMTSSSSGHSSEERWYEVLENGLEGEGGGPVDSSPPPLPARLNAYLQVSPVKTNSCPLLDSQHEFKVGEKVTTCLLKAERSHELRRQHTQAPERSSGLQHHDYHASQAMLDYNGSQYIGSSLIEKSASLPLDCSTASMIRHPPASDGHSTDTSSTSDRLFGLPSEDDLSGSSSPRLRRCKTTGSMTAGRVESPRSNTGVGGMRNTGVAGGGGGGDNGEARLRPGVTARSQHQRNSANLHQSTLQQDLMRLINPDYMPPSTDDIKEPNNKCSNNGSCVSLPESLGKSRSRENLASLSLSSQHAISSSMNSHGGSGGTNSRPHSPPTRLDPVASTLTPQEVILTMARPATVISNASTASSPAPSENKLSKEERLSPRVTKLAAKQNCGGGQDPQQETTVGDWPSLVESATTAGSLMADQHLHHHLHQHHHHINHQQDVEGSSSSAVERLHWVEGLTQHATNVDTAVTPQLREQELNKHISQLEGRLSRETMRRLSLEEEVRNLKEENRRLQQESQSAAQQLRRFTEWFFQTIDKQ